MFKFGDLVIGNKNNHYGYTKEGSLNLVLKIINSSEMVVITLESPLLPSELDGITREEFDDEIEDILSDGSSYNSSRICAFRVDINKFTACTFESYEEYKATRNNIEKSPAYEFIIELMKKGEVSFDTTKVMEPVLHTNGTYSFTNKQKEYVTKNMAELLTKYEHANSPKGIDKIWEVFCSNKAGAIAILSKHPNWVEDVMGIVFEGSYKRTVDSSQINSFSNWCKTQLGKWASDRQYKYHCCTVDELRGSFTKLRNLVYYVDKIYDTSNNSYSVVINGMNFDELKAERQRVKELFDHAYMNSFEIATDEGNIYLSQENYAKFMKAIEFINLIRCTTANIADATFAEKVNRMAEPFNTIDKNGKVKGFGAVAGQKISRIVGKFFKNYGFNKITDYRSAIHVDENGVVHEGVKRDYGWNREFALYCDAINILEFKRWTIISVNPLDYLTMSFGHKWQSCHTIDKRNIRGIDSGHVYHGMYCSGTMSYMLDKSSIIMYTIDEKYKGTEYWKQDKFNRCMFHIGEDKFIQGRLYPDGRDGGDSSLSAQFRNIFQKVISECIEESNMWRLSKGITNCSKVAITRGTHYADYLNYGDCSVSYLKRNGVEINKNRITIGHNPICPNCGDEHERGDYLSCCSNSQHERCCYCDEEIDLDDYIVDEDTERIYCSPECANNDDVYYCENVNEWHSENVYWDNYCDEYFYATDDMVAVEGRYDTLYYMDSDNAESDGWHYIESENEWLNEESSRNPHGEEILQCYECCEWFMADTMREDMYGDWYCEDCAENNPERFENEDDDLIDESNGVA